MGSSSDAFRFRGRDVKEAADVLDDLRVGGVNKSELAREGVKSILRDVTTGDEKAEVFARYQRGEIGEEAARIFLGEALDAMETDAEETREALDRDTSGLVQ